MKDLIDQFDDERRKLARQLHSTAAQQLAALQIQLSLIGNAKLDERAAKSLHEASELAQACSREIRAVCTRLYPPLLDEVGLAAAIRAFANEQGCRLTSDFPEEIEPIPRRIALGAFRIAEDLVLDSPAPERTTIGMKRHTDKAVLTVSGAGEIRELVQRRVDLLGGELWHHHNGGWTTIIVSLPLTSGES